MLSKYIFPKLNKIFCSASHLRCEGPEAIGFTFLANAFCHMNKNDLSFQACLCSGQQSRGTSYLMFSCNVYECERCQNNASQPPPHPPKKKEKRKDRETEIHYSCFGDRPWLKCMVVNAAIFPSSHHLQQPDDAASGNINSFHGMPRTFSEEKAQWGWMRRSRGHALYFRSQKKMISVW